MALECSLDNGICIVVLTEDFGDMPGDPIDDVRAAFKVEDLTGVLLDLEQTPFLDSSGIGKIMLLFKDLQEYDIPLALCHVSHKNQKVLKITQIDSLFPTYSTKVEALESMTKNN